MWSAESPGVRAAVPALDEARRLATLRRLRILDSSPERDFDDLVVLASEVFDVPIALISLVDRDRQWFKAKIGLAVDETERSIAFCATAIRSPDEVFVVEDASHDARFVKNPLVVSDPNIRFYAGAPIVASDGATLGTVCVMDRKAGTLGATQRRCLEALARQARTLIETRAEALEAADAEAALLERNEMLEHDIDRQREERDRQQKALDAAESALRQSQKMEALGQLTGGLAHDFNNLLTGIIGSLELLQLRVAQGRIGELDRYLGVARSAANRAAALTHRLLAFARRQTLDPKATDIDALVRSMEELLRRTVGPEIELAVVVGLPPVRVAMVDTNQLENVLLNLCINARDAMPDGGRLTISVATHSFDPLVPETPDDVDLPPGQFVAVRVADTGTGMSDEVMKHAFEPFFTTKPLGLGTGLGLSMVYGFARQSDGRVHIASAVGAGTTVTLFLPRHDGAAEHSATPAAGTLTKEGQRGRTVLVVDDEAAIRMLIVEVLGDLGYSSLEAEDGASGLKLLQSDARIDLLITDVGLPGGLNGRQIADAARSMRPGLRVLFITGYAETSAVGGGGLDAGMQVLTKPFSLDALANRIADLLPDGPIV